MPLGARISELPITTAGGNQAQRRTNRWAAFAELEQQQDTHEEELIRQRLPMRPPGVTAFPNYSWGHTACSCNYVSSERVILCCAF